MQNKKTRGGGSRGTRRISPTTVVEKLGNTCLLEQEQKRQQCHKVCVRSREDIRTMYCQCNDHMSHMERN